MATHHAAPGEVVNLATWAQDLPQEHSKAIAKTSEMELARLVIPAGEVIGNHHIAGPLILHCLSGKIEVSALDEPRNLEDGELLYLPPGEKFTIKATEQALLLMTFIFNR